MKATCIANSNIALVKYWGKRNEKLILPCNSSISVTLDGLETTTTVEFGEKYKKDEFFFNGKKTEDKQGQKVSNHLALARKTLGKKLFARVQSQSNFPVAAGLASSASGFASLTVAAVNALGSKLSQKELSILARQGSGSASRSIFGGFAEWKKGVKKNGSDSYAFQLFPKEHWPEFRVIVCIVESTEKKIKSRQGMEQTVKTSPFYKDWLLTIEKDLNLARNAIRQKNMELLGMTAEVNSLKMHATMLTAKPAIVYWQPKTVELIHLVEQIRENGMQAYHTMDAGPQVKIMCLEKDAQKIKKLAMETGIQKTIEARPGDAARITEKHLF